MANQNQNQEVEPADEMAAFIGEAGKDGEIIPPPKPDAKAAEGVDDGDADGDAGGADKSGDDADAGTKAAADDSEENAAKDEKDAEADDETEEKPSNEEKKPKKKQTAEQRIGQERWRRGEAERQRDAALAELETLRTGNKDLTRERSDAKSSAAPDPADPKYKYGEVDPAYLADTVTFHTKKALAEAEAEKETARQSDAVAAKQEKDMKAVGEVITSGRSEFEDFDDVVLKSPLIAKELPPALHDLLLGSEPKMGAQIAYHLASNPEEARKVYGKTPLEQAAYFGRLEARFSAPAAPKTSKAPPPPKDKARGAGGKFATTADTTDFAAFEKLAEKL